MSIATTSSNADKLRRSGMFLCRAGRADRSMPSDEGQFHAAPTELVPKRRGNGFL